MSRTFNGTSSYMNVPAGVFDSLSTVTVSCWANVASVVSPSLAGYSVLVIKDLTNEIDFFDDGTLQALVENDAPGNAEGDFFSRARA